MSALSHVVNQLKAAALKSVVSAFLERNVNATNNVARKQRAVVPTSAVIAPQMLTVLAPRSVVTKLKEDAVL